MERFEFASCISASAETVYNWHKQPGTLERLTPPWENVRVIDRSGGIEDCGQVVLEVSTPTGKQRWVAKHGEFEPGRMFSDVQVEGPFASWTHTHRMIPQGSDVCELREEIDYELPYGAVGRLFGSSMVRDRLASMFAYRHRITANDLMLHHRFHPGRPLKVLITGASGLVGSALTHFLTSGGHEVVSLTRSPRSDREIGWDPAARQLEAHQLEGFDAVVHLAGENIADKRWTDEQKIRIRGSRVQGTQLLSGALANLRNPPAVLISASAIGYYGDRGEAVLDEASPPGDNFLAKVCQDWEAAAAPAAEAGIRVMHPRIGIVLSPAGGALAQMLTPFKMGLGGKVGSGKQYWSFIALDDLIGVIYHAMVNESLHGPVNAVAAATTNSDFTTALGKVLHRPTILPMPGIAARIALGEMANELLLASTRVDPRVLRETNHPFLFPDSQQALGHLLGTDLQGPRQETSSAVHADAVS